MMDLDPRARRILELTREARTPSALDKARVERLVAVGIGLAAASTAHAASGTTVSKATGALVSLKWAAGVALFAAAGAVGYAEWRASMPSHVVAGPSVSTTARVAAVPDQARNASSPDRRGASTVSPAPVVSESPSESLGTAASAKDKAKVEARARVRAAAEHPEGWSERARAPSAENTLSDELDLLHDAQFKWRSGDAAGALSLLALHRKRFPRSELGPEREALTVLALCATGRTDDARQLAARFLRSAKRSPLRTSVEESCGGR
jgi:hypothetical protein